jgi:hypothetical protein
MRKLIGYHLCVAALCFGAATNALAGGGAFTRGCAARDIQIMMMLETSPMSPRQLDDAVNTMMHARVMCFDGQVMDALALYDQIAEIVTSNWIASGPSRESLH